MVDLVNVTCGSCDFEQMLLIGTSNLDQVYNDLNDDFNYYKIFYCPTHRAFANLETFNPNLSRQHFDNYTHHECPAKVGCTSVIEVEDTTRFTRDNSCPKCGNTSLKVTSKEMLDD